VIRGSIGWPRSRCPAFSPDGSQIAFAWNGDQRGNADIYIKRIDADTPLRLTTDPADDSAPAWSPDGSRLAFVRGANGPASIYVTAPVPGAERKLVDYTPSLPPNATGRSETLYRFDSLRFTQGLSVSADEKTVIFCGISPAKNADLMLIENFR